MKTFTAVVERCADTGLYVGYVPGFAGAHSQGASLDELRRNLEEVVGLWWREPAGVKPEEIEFPSARAAFRICLGSPRGDQPGAAKA